MTAQLISDIVETSLDAVLLAYNVQTINMPRLTQRLAQVFAEELATAQLTKDCPPLSEYDLAA